MFERFTESARQVVVLAQEEARTLRHGHIGAEHVLLGLSRASEGITAGILRSFGLTTVRLRAHIVPIVPEGDEIRTGQIPFTPRGKKVLELALREALSLGHNFIDSQHVLLGLLREQEGVAAQVLSDFDVDRVAMRDAILETLPPITPRPPFSGPSGDSRRAAAELATWAGAMSRTVGRAADAPATPSSNAERATLARAGAAVAYAGGAVALSVVDDLLALTAGEIHEGLGPLRAHPGVLALAALGWPAAARVGLVVWLAATLSPDEQFAAPPTASRMQLSRALERALAGAAVAGERPSASVAQLSTALDAVDDRFTQLLEILGSDAVAEDPTLVLRYAGHAPRLMPLSPRQQLMLGTVVQLEGEGSAEGRGGGGDRGGLIRHGNLSSILPTQLVLPPKVLAMRHSRDELLYRTHRGRPPGAPRAAIIILDDTPATVGQVGVTLRVVSHLCATALVRRHRECALITLSDPSQPVMLAQRSDLLRIWTAGGLKPARPDAAFSAAGILAPTLSHPTDGPPRVLLLTHPHQPHPPWAGLRTLRVHYPGHPTTTDEPGCRVIAPDPAPAALQGAITMLLSET